MNEIALALNNLTDVLHNNGLPFWLSILAVVVPIIQTAVIIALTIIQDKNGKALQKQIANRDMMNQVRQNVLQIYNVFLQGLNTCTPGEQSVTIIVSTQQSIWSWAQEIENTNKQIMYAYNQANLLLDDAALVTTLKECMVAYGELYNSVMNYLNSNMLLQTIGNAWYEISSKYGIPNGDYFTLNQNKLAYEQYTNLCENSQTRIIHSKIQKYISLTANQSFDDKFKKYVRIEELK